MLWQLYLFLGIPYFVLLWDVRSEQRNYQFSRIINTLISRSCVSLIELNLLLLYISCCSHGMTSKMKVLTGAKC